MPNAYVLGAGMVPFGRHPDTPVEELGGWACLAALEDAGLGPGSLNAAYCGHVAQGMTLGERILDRVGLAGVPVANFENACASSSTALHFACLSVSAGQYDVVLVVGAEKMKHGLLPLGHLLENDLDVLVGRTVPARSALFANRYAVEFGLTPEDLAAVAVKNSRNAALNPYAQLRQSVTIEEVLAAPMIATPLTRLMCCPTSDGAAAVVVGSAAVARRLRHRAVEIVASHLQGGECLGTRKVGNSTARAAAAVYTRAGLGPGDVDLVEALDHTVMAEILLYEDLGFCSPGDGVELVRHGETGREGRVAFSPGGGLLKRGHPLGATGVAQVAEAVWQLRGEAGARQVPGARVALTHAAGSVFTGMDDEASVTVHLLAR